jgi:hypothetical protein
MQLVAARFEPLRTYQVKTWFQAFAFSKCYLCRYAAVHSFSLTLEALLMLSDKYPFLTLHG